MVMAAGLVAWAGVTVDTGRAALVALGAAAAVVVAGSLVLRSPVVLAAGISGLVGMAAVTVLLRPGASALWAGLAAYLVTELAFATVEREPAAAVSPAVELRRWELVALVAAVSLAAGSLALAVGGTVDDGGLGLELAGAAATGGVSVLVVALARRVGRSPAGTHPTPGAAPAEARDGRPLLAPAGSGAGRSRDSRGPWPRRPGPTD